MSSPQDKNGKPEPIRIEKQHIDEALRQHRVNRKLLDEVADIDIEVSDDPEPEQLPKVIWYQVGDEIEYVIRGRFRMGRMFKRGGLTAAIVLLVAQWVFVHQESIRTFVVGLLG